MNLFQMMISKALQRTQGDVTQAQHGGLTELRSRDTCLGAAEKAGIYRSENQKK